MTVPLANETLSLLAVVLICQTRWINVSESKGNGNNAHTEWLYVQGLCAPCLPSFSFPACQSLSAGSPLSMGNQQPVVGIDDQLKSVNTQLSDLYWLDSEAEMTFPLQFLDIHVYYKNKPSCSCQVPLCVIFILAGVILYMGKIHPYLSDFESKVSI